MAEKFIALIPAYKPEAVLIDLLRELCDSGFECVVVDDGGGAEYADIFKEASAFATVLTHPVNRGKGAAMKTGYTHILEKYGSGRTVVTVDADGQHKVADAIRVCEAANNEPGSLVLGSRKFKGDIPFRSRFGNSVTRFVYMISTGLKVHDTQTGLRVCSTSLLPDLINISGDRYEYEMNVLLEFARHKIPIKELEIETVYIGKNESSHFNPLHDSIRIYKEILKFSLSSFIGFLVDYTIYSILTLLSFKLVFANVAARIVSASVNYTINRKFVFKNKGNVIKSALEYFILAACILVGNTFTLNFLVYTCGMNKMVAKILTEIIFYILSWLVQRFIIFKKKKDREDRSA